MKKNISLPKEQMIIYCDLRSSIHNLKSKQDRAFSIALSTGELINAKSIHQAIDLIRVKAVQYSIDLTGISPKDTISIINKVKQFMEALEKH